MLPNLQAPSLFRIGKIVGDNHRYRENSEGGGNSYKDVKIHDLYAHNISKRKCPIMGLSDVGLIVVRLSVIDEQCLGAS